MEGQEVMEGVREVGVDLLEDLDSYFEDINDRLSISRMVNDSVIKGMVKAVQQLAAEEIAAKEMEVAVLKEKLHFLQLHVDKCETMYGKYRKLDFCLELFLSFISFSQCLVKKILFPACIDHRNRKN